MPEDGGGRLTSRSGARSKGEKAEIVTQSEALVPADAFGGKNIAAVAGFMLLVNNVTGPGLVGLSGVNVDTGYIMVFLFLVMCFGISALSCTMLLEAIKKVPGNSRFDQRIEFTTLAKMHFSGDKHWMYLVTLSLLMFLLQSQLVSSVIESVQMMDATLIKIFDKSCGLQVGGTDGSKHVGFICIGAGDADGDSPFGDGFVISIGYWIVAALSLPLGFFNLDDNIIVQKFAFWGLCFIMGEWVIECFVDGLDFDHSDPGASDDGDGRVPAFGSSWSAIFNGISTIFFNYGYVITVPSWANERIPGVSINRSVWLSGGLGTFMFMTVGLFTAGVWDFSDGSDLLAKLTSANTYPQPSTLMQVLAFAFPSIVLITSIPIFSIIIRYNLMESNLCGAFWATFWGTIFPWILSIVFFPGNLLNPVINVSGLITIAPLNFILPAYFYIRSFDGALGDADGEAGGLLDGGEEDAALARGRATVAPSADQLQVGTRVDAWFPGYQWSRGVIVEKSDDETYTVQWDEEDEKGVTSYTPNVQARNIRLAGDPRTRKSEYLQHGAYKCPHTPRPDMVQLNPEQLKAKEHVDDLQMQLDMQEQRIEDVRTLLHELIIQHPDRNERRAEKDAKLREMVELQKGVEGLIDEMRAARQAATGKGGAWELPPEQRDELFTALPHKWSAQTKKRLAWAHIAVCCVLNVMAIAAFGPEKGWQ